MILIRDIEGSKFNPFVSQRYTVGCDYTAAVLLLKNCPKDRCEHVIVTESILKGHPTTLEAHFYESGETALDAFRQGLIKQFTPEPPAEDYEGMLKQLMEPSEFANHPGFIRTLKITTDAERKFWFLAQEGDPIDDDFCYPLAKA